LVRRFLVVLGQRCVNASIPSNKSWPTRSELPTLGRICSECGSRARSNSASSSIEGQTVWFKSFRQPNCGSALGIDSTHEPGSWRH
jgi:hypothetical protein